MCRVSVSSVQRVHRSRAVVAAALLVLVPTTAAHAQEFPGLDLSPGDLVSTSPFGVGIDLSLADTEIGVELPGGRLVFDVALPTGYILRGVSCPDGVTVGVSGTTVSLDPSEGVDLGACVLQIVDGVAASAAAVPAVLQRNDILLSVELGLDHQLDRFGTSESSDSGFPKPSGLGASTIAPASDSTAAPLAFSASLQQRYAPPQKLGAGGRSPAAPISRAFNIWAEGYIAHVETDTRDGSSDGHAGVLFAGADYLLSPHVLLGLLVQYDEQQRSFDGAALRFSDHGWLVGPYAVFRLADETFLQVRAAAGQTQNDLRLDGVFDDSFDSDRWLVKARLLTNLKSGNWLVRPSVSVAYVEDELQAYHSSSGINIGQRTLSLGQMKFGPEIAYRYVTGDYVVTPSLTVEGIWNFDRRDTGIGFDDLVDTAAVRGRIEAGTTFQNSRGTSLGFAASYDGIGTSDFTALGGRARLTIPLD